MVLDRYQCTSPPLAGGTEGGNTLPKGDVMMTEESVSIPCIACPQGCLAEITVKDGEIVSISGAQCKRGQEYVVQEYTDPRRVLTSTVQLQNGQWLPVRSRGLVPKGLLFDIMLALRQVCPNPPVDIGEVILPNVLDTGVDIVASAPSDLGQFVPGQFVPRYSGR